MKLAIAVSACASIMLTTALFYSLTRACICPRTHSFRILICYPFDFTYKWVYVCMAVGVACVLCLYSFLVVFSALYKFVCVCVCVRACTII